MDIISIIKNIPSFRNAPDNMIIAMVAALGAVGLIFIFVIVMFLVGYSNDESKKKEEKAPPTHKVILELKDALVQEMRGTSRQNTIMIWLTIIFIAISLIGIAATVLGPDFFSVLIRKTVTPLSHGAKMIKPATLK